MKKNLNPKKLLSCALLMLGGISSLQAATLTVKVKDSYGKKLSGVSVQWVTSGFTTLGTTDTTGEVTGTIPDNINYKVKVTYGGTSYQTLTPKNSGYGSNRDTFYTSELKVVTKSGGQPVAGMGVQYMTGYPTGSWIQAGSTDAFGVKSIQVFPFNNLNVKIYANGSYETHTIATFPYGTSKADTFSNLVKLQSPNTYFLVGSSWLSGNAGLYVFPGTYQTRVNNTYLSSVTLAGSLFNKVPVAILVKDHSNNPIKGATLRGGYGNIPNGGSFGWHCATTDSNGITIEWTNPVNKICSYEARVNNTTTAQSKDVTLTNGNLFTFKTSVLTLKLKDCDSNGIAGGTARYGIGSNSTAMFFPGVNRTANDGTLSMEAFPGTYSFEMGINQSTQVKQIVFDGTNGLTWVTSNVSINWPYAVAYGGNGGSAWFPNKAGTPMLPGTWNFRLDAPGNSIVAPITVSGCSTSKSPLIVRLLRANGTPIENGQPYYHANGWQAMPPTNAAGNSVALVDGTPGWMYTQMSYLGGNQVKQDDLTTNRIVTYQTKPVTIDFKASDNKTVLKGENLQFHSDQWRPFGTNGTTTMELLPLNYYFSLSYEGGTETKQQDVALNPTVSYRTKLVTIDFTNSNGDHSLESNDLKFHSDTWRTFGTTGTTTGGKKTMQLLPLNYYFSLSYKGGTETKQQDVTSDSTVEFQTKLVTMDFKASDHTTVLQGENLKFHSDQWRDFEPVSYAKQPAMELLPLTYYFSLSYQGGTETKQQYVASDSIVKFRTKLVTIDFKASDNETVLEGKDLKFHSDQWRNFEPVSYAKQPAMELLPLTYYFSLSHQGATETKQQYVATDSIVPFRTTLVTMKLNDRALPEEATDRKFYSNNEWKTFGTDGNASMELLPLDYYFGLSYKGSALSTQQNVAANNNVVNFVPASTMRKSANTLTTTEVSFYPNPAISNLHVSMPAAGKVEIFSIEGKKLAQYEVAEGTTTIDISSIPVGNHIMIAHYGDQHETFKFVKL